MNDTYIRRLQDAVTRAEKAEAERDRLAKERDEALGAAECSAETEGAYFAWMQTALDKRDRLAEALNDACDVAIWLSALIPHDGEIWQTWENMMRPKLYAALASLSNPDGEA